jgi:hypothetical protein
MAIASLPSRADSPAPPQSYELLAPGGKYVFVMIAPGAGAQGVGRAFPQSGMYRNGGSVEPLWTVGWYARNVEVASDGIHLVRHGPWASSVHDEAISFFANGNLLRTFPIRELVDDTAKLERSVSHFLWREGGQLDDAGLSYALKTKDGNRFLFDVRTGTIVSEFRSRTDAGTSTGATVERR